MTKTELPLDLDSAEREMTMEEIPETLESIVVSVIPCVTLSPEFVPAPLVALFPLIATLGLRGLGIEEKQGGVKASRVSLLEELE